MTSLNERLHGIYVNYLVYSNDFISKIVHRLRLKWTKKLVRIEVLKIQIFLDVDLKKQTKKNNSWICYVNLPKMHVYSIGTSDIL